MITYKKIKERLLHRLEPFPQLIADIKEEEVYSYTPDGQKHPVSEKGLAAIKELEDEWQGDRKGITVVIDDDSNTYILFVTKYDLYGSRDSINFCSYYLNAYRFHAELVGSNDEDYIKDIGIESTPEGGIRKIWYR